jgi:tRNA threonylcarbamoyladenosine biosynthesis protein TsaE
MIKLRTFNATQTIEFGRWLGAKLPIGSVIGLDGDLGAGKTTLSKGIVQGVGTIDEAMIKSPAFNLVHQYDLATKTGHVTVNHIDFYRLDELLDSDCMLFCEYFDMENAIHLVEWANKFLSELVPDYLSIVFTIPTDADNLDERDIQIKAMGNSALHQRLIEEVSKYEYTGD